MAKREANRRVIIPQHVENLCKDRAEVVYKQVLEDLGGPSVIRSYSSSDIKRLLIDTWAEGYLSCLDNIEHIKPMTDSEKEQLRLEWNASVPLQRAHGIKADPIDKEQPIYKVLPDDLEIERMKK